MPPFAMTLRIKTAQNTHTKYYNNIDVLNKNGWTHNLICQHISLLKVEGCGEKWTFPTFFLYKSSQDICRHLTSDLDPHRHRDRLPIAIENMPWRQHQESCRKSPAQVIRGQWREKSALDLEAVWLSSVLGSLIADTVSEQLRIKWSKPWWDDEMPTSKKLKPKKKGKIWKLESKVGKWSLNQPFITIFFHL